MGLIGDALQAEGIAFEYIRGFAGDTVPETLGDASALVVMGGPMGVYEQNEYPFLREELRLIESAVRDGRPVLGVCLGSQLVASACGAEVRKSGKKEIGWFDVSLSSEGLTDPLFADTAASFTAFHWHGDIFDLPPGSVRLASSRQTINQAFRFAEGVYGLLFHIEVNPRIIGDMVAGFTGELKEEGLDGAVITGSAGQYLDQTGSIAARVFGRWARLVKERS
jgi:GMP synthase (glutamine-hydrolysing)